MGPQGSGKGTQGQRLAQEYNLKIIEVGQILRDKSSEHTPEGEYIRDYIKTGKLFPSDFINELVGNYWKSLPQDQGVLFDGYPRKKGQVKFLDQHMAAENRR